MDRTPLDKWIVGKILGGSSTRSLSLADVNRHQLEKLKETIDYVRSYSSFYRAQLAGFPSGLLRNLEDLKQFPFTTLEDLQERGSEFLCVSQSAIKRVITLQVPGTTAKPRRLYFTEEDIELTTDFFRHGMSTFVEPGQKILVLMPGDRPTSVGDLLVQALRRINVEGVVHGLVTNPDHTVREIVRQKADCLVGIPAQVLSLVRNETGVLIPHGQIKSVLLSSDYVSPAITQELTRTWGCAVFNHYGSTEMGLGGGVECQAFQGYHLREADLYFEIVDPASGEPQPTGTWGEIVFSTLTRRGMPLIRYRTGDLSRFLTGVCPCGTGLRRLDRVRGRLNDFVRLGKSHWLSTVDLDDVLFPIPGLLDYQAVLTDGNNKDRLDILVHARKGEAEAALEAVSLALAESEALREPIRDGSVSLGSVSSATEQRIATGAAKRSIHDLRGASSKTTSLEYVN
jgi:phenylacetate-coenzyme A ligase PaaK-like adenylate-forming protein